MASRHTEFRAPLLNRCVVLCLTVISLAAQPSMGSQSAGVEIRP